MQVLGASKDYQVFQVLLDQRVIEAWMVFLACLDSLA